MLEEYTKGNHYATRMSLCKVRQSYQCCRETIDLFQGNSTMKSRSRSPGYIACKIKPGTITLQVLTLTAITASDKNSLAY